LSADSVAFHFPFAQQTPEKETTPSVITQAIKDFGGVLGGTPVSVPVIQDAYGVYGFCSDGVREKIKHDGGSIKFGWTLWEWPNVWLNAEFHAVWVDPTGSYWDITPKPQNEKSIVFVPDESKDAGFNFLQRPMNRRWKIYQPPSQPNPLVEARKRIAAMKPKQIEYETERAGRNEPHLGKLDRQQDQGPIRSAERTSRRLYRQPTGRLCERNPECGERSARKGWYRYARRDQKAGEVARIVTR
jgi:hypothetical protein